MNTRSTGYLLFAMIVTSGCGADDAEPLVCTLCPSRERAPEMMVPAANPMSDAKIELGRHLFYDQRLSGNNEQACASCHEQARAFSDGKARPLGSTGHPIARNAQPLANVGYLSVYTWANPRLQSLEQQALVPLFADLPAELGAADYEEEILDRLRADPEYPALFAEAFPEPSDGIGWNHVIQAIASFERALVSFDAPYDRYLRGDASAISDSAKRGLKLFRSERLACHRCHAGFNFTSAVRMASGEGARDSFVNTGLYNLDGKGGYPEGNSGLYEFTASEADIGRFRVPTLRNISVTGPYMHDGSLQTLNDVIDHYARGGRLIESGPLSGDGAANPHKDSLLVGFVISAGERADLIAFLESLTDEGFLTDPRFSNPFEPR